MAAGTRDAGSPCGDKHQGNVRDAAVTVDASAHARRQDLLA
jgi:hypothetical protein